MQPAQATAMPGEPYVGYTEAPLLMPTQVTPVAIPTGQVVQRELQTRRVELPESRMRRSFRIPVVAALVWIVTMLAIFYLGRQVAGYYAPVVQGEQVEFVGRS